MPQMPRSDEEERGHQRRKDQMAVQGPLVRGVRVTRVRPQVRGPARRSGLAVLQGEPGGAPHPGQEPEAREPADVGFVAARAAGPDRARRGAPRRHPPAPRRGRAHRGLRRPRGRMARGEERDGRGLVVAAVQDRAAAGGGVRRRGRRAQGAARCLAVHPGAALPVPRVHEHHRADRAQAAPRGRQTPQEGRGRAVARLGRRDGRRVDGVVQPVGAGLRRLPRPEEPLGGRHRRRPAHAPGQGPPDGAQADQGGAAVHVPRPAGRMRGADPAHEQPHRVVERAHPRHAPPPPRPVPGAADQGDLLVVPPAHRGPGDGRVARGQRRHGRTDRGALPEGMGEKARRAHGRRPASRCSTEPGSPGTTSTAPPNTTAPPSRLRPDTHFGL